METTSLTFAEPVRLWLLLLAPVLAGLFLWSHARGRALVARVVAPRLREQLAGSVSVPRRIFRAVCLVGAFGLAVVALAQPRLGVVELETKHRGRDVIVAVDTSRSMNATDIQPDRLARAKLFTRDLVRLLAGDRVGLVAFAGSAFLQAPLTLDDSALINALGELDTSVIPRGGTNIAAAIETALEAFGKAEGMSRALVILTDGEELDADGLAAARRAAEQGVRIYTVGIGSVEGSLIPDPDTGGGFVRDLSGKPVLSKLDEARLREIAEVAGGFYVPIGPDAARDIFQNGIVPMELAEKGVLTTRRPIERFQWPLGAAVLLLVAGILPGERRRRPVAIAVLAVCLGMPVGAGADATGLEAWNEGDFGKAEGIFRQRLEEQPDSPAIRFNAGAAAYRNGDFEQAVEDFTGALLSEDPALRADASYNLANSLVRGGEAAADPEDKKSKWESAIEHYGSTLELEPENADAQANRDLVERMLEELEQQKQQQEEESGGESDQQDESESGQEESSEEESGESGGEEENQEGSEGESGNDESTDGESQEQQDESSSGESGEEEGESEEGSEGQENPSDSSADEGQPDGGAVPTPTPGDKKEGELRSAGEEEGSPGEQTAPPGEVVVEDTNMSAAEARALLDSLRGDERKVNLMQQQASQPVTRDW
jgi:Ca-activated chloride channel homolog